MRGVDSGFLVGNRLFDVAQVQNTREGST
jgi:hypothetical protein